MQNSIVKFQDKELELINIDGKAYMRSSDVAQALEYEELDSITKIFNRNKDEFTSEMSFTVKLAVKGYGNGNSKKTVRVFSLRGCHLVAMLSNTPIAKVFRSWCLDILEGKIILPFGHPHPTQPFPICPAYEEQAFVLTIKTAVRDELDAYFADTIRLQNDIKNSEAYLNGLLEGAFGNSRSMNKIREIAKCAMPRRS